ncbi:MAG: MFS transporter [Anaerolineae bacterium]
MFNVIILGLTSFLTDTSTEMVYPLLPLYLTTRLGASPAIVGLIEGIAESLASLLKVFSGYISDRVGRRKPLAILGYASSTVGKFLLYLSTSWGWVLGGRVVDRFGKGVRTAPRDALIADSTAQARRGGAYGLHRALDTAGAVVGVALAYYFLTAYRGDYTAVFLYSLIPAGLGVAILLLARERAGRIPVTSQAQSPSLRWSALPRRLQAFLIVVLLFALGNSSNQFLLLRAQNLGFTAQTVLLLYLAYNLVYALISYPAGRLSDRIGRKTLLVLGYLFYGLVYLGFALVQAPAYVWSLFAAYGLYIAFTEGVEKALMADIAPLELRATLIGLHATFVGIGLLPASLLAGLLWNLFGAAAPFYFGGGLGLLAALGLWLVI